MRVGLFYILAGKGHYIPAKNICESLTAMGHEAEMIDIFTLYNDGGASGRVSENGWKFLQQHTGLEGIYTAAMDNRLVGKLQIDVGFRPCLKAFKEWYDRFKPDAVGGTVWIASRALEFFRRELKLDFKVFHYSPDVVWGHINSVSDGYDRYFISTDEGVEWAKRIGQDPATIEKCAFPIQSNILNSKRITKKEARAKLGIEDKFTVQLSMGGEGILSMPLLEHLAEAKSDLQVLCLGKLTEKTSTSYDEFRAKHPGITVLTPGFVNDVQNYTMACDLVVVKYGANASMESFYLGRPVLITDTYYAGHEFVKFLEKHRIGWHGATIPEQTEIILRLAENPSLLDDAEENIRNLDVGFGADDIARKIITMCC